jgi:ABC-type multidrug transport system fused ATPase/permease subunit
MIGGMGRPGGGGGMRRNLDSDDKKREKLVSDRELLRFSLGYLLKYKKWLYLTTSLLVLSTLLSLIPDLLIRQIIDVNIAQRQYTGLIITVSAMIGIHIISWIFTFIDNYYITKLGQTTIYDMRTDMFDRLVNQSQEYYDKNQSGRINSVLTNDLDTLGGFLGGALVSIISAILQLVSIIIIMLILDVPLALISFSMIPAFIILAWFIRNPVRKISQLRRKTIAAVTSNLAENISGAKVSKTFAREKLNKKEFENVNRENFKASMKAVSIFALIFPLVGIISAFGTMAILWYSGYQVAINNNPNYTTGLVATFMSYLTRFFGPVFILSMFYSNFQSALAALERVYLFLNEEIPIQNEKEAREFTPKEGHIEFNNVDFYYNEENIIFEDLSVEISGGSVVALVGATGAGKSTFIKLLNRSYDIKGGSLKIDGQELKSVTLSSLRAEIGVVPQEPRLFNTSIFENIRYGNVSSTLEDVIEICKTVGIHDYINRLPEGYITKVNEGGSRLSKGQRQLVSFARVLLKNPKILILDEATSSLDVVSEIAVQEVLETVLKGRTAIIVAHRLSTIRKADRILVLEKGKIIQEGNHHELVRTKGKYQDLYLKQFFTNRDGIEAKINT